MDLPQKTLRSSPDICMTFLENAPRWSIGGTTWYGLQFIPLGFSVPWRFLGICGKIFIFVDMPMKRRSFIVDLMEVWCCSPVSGGGYQNALIINHLHNPAGAIFVNRSEKSSLSC